MMFLRFLAAVFLPPIALAVAVCIGVFSLGDSGGLVFLVGIPAALVWSFVALTGGKPYRPVRKSAPQIDIEPNQAPPKWAVVILPICIVMGLASLLMAYFQRIGDWIMVPGQNGDWLSCAGGVLLLSSPFFVLLFWWVNAFQSFIRAEASREVRRFHARNREFLGNEYPRAVVDSELYSIQADATPEQAWRIASEILRKFGETIKRSVAERLEKERVRRIEDTKKAATTTTPSSPVSVPAESFVPPVPFEEQYDPPPQDQPIDSRVEAEAELERDKTRARKEASRLLLPPEILAADLERLDEEFRIRFGEPR